jgi:signal peptide peptidase SppA
MKSYPHVISKLFYEPLIITHARHAAMARVLESRMAAEADVRGQKAEDSDESMDPLKPIAPDMPEAWDGGGETVVIPVEGVLVGRASDIPMSSCGCGCDVLAKLIDEAVADSNVKRIVFDFNSPGGAVTGIPELGRKIAGIVTKQTMGFTDSECCSGALWLATQCQSFHATESSSVGSIGVWCAYLDLSRQMDRDGASMQEISAGKYKTMGAYWKPLSKEERGMIQKQVDKIYGQFKTAVNTRREVAEEFMQGQVFDGAEAAAIGLCDGTVEGLEELLG